MGQDPGLSFPGAVTSSQLPLCPVTPAAEPVTLPDGFTAPLPTPIRAGLSPSSPFTLRSWRADSHRASHSILCLESWGPNDPHPLWKPRGVPAPSSSGKETHTAHLDALPTGGSPSCLLSKLMEWALTRHFRPHKPQFFLPPLTLRTPGSSPGGGGARSSFVFTVGSCASSQTLGLPASWWRGSPHSAPGSEDIR